MNHRARDTFTKAERVSQCVSVGVRGLSKREGGGRRVRQEKEEEGTERQESQGSSG